MSEKKLAILPTSSSALTKHTWNKESMATARCIVLDDVPEGVYIYRYSEDWEFGGDTWHQNIGDALHQIEYEFGVENLEWQPISDDELSQRTTKLQA